MSYPIDGSYDQQSQAIETRNYCCQIPAVNPRDQFWPDHMTKKILATENKNWHSVIGWVPFFNTSVYLFDMHVGQDFNQSGNVDCLHYIYSPRTYEFLWWEIQKEIRRLISTNFKIHDDKKQAS